MSQIGEFKKKPRHVAVTHLRIGHTAYCATSNSYKNKST